MKPFVLLLAVVSLCAQTKTGGLTPLGVVDSTGATSTAPIKSGTSLPGTCSVGQLYFKTDATASAVLYSCTSANTWTNQSGSTSVTPTTCSNQFINAINSSAVGTCATITLASAAFANQGTTTTVLHGNASGNPSFGAVVGADMTANTVTSTQMAVVNTRRTCPMIVGSDDAASALTDANIGPQNQWCQVPYAAIVVEVDVNADAGTPSVIPRKRHCSASSGGVCTTWTTSDLLSGALSAAASNFSACSNTGGTTGLDTVTTCTNTLQNTSLAAGDWIELKSGTAGGTAKRLSVMVHFTVN